MSSKTKDLITKKDLRQISWRALQGATSVNYERFVHKPLTWQVGPALRKIWGDDPEKHAAALQRHLAFFLCTPQVKSWMGGLMVGLECELKDNPDMDPDSINNTREMQKAKVETSRAVMVPAGTTPGWAGYRPLLLDGQKLNAEMWGSPYGGDSYIVVNPKTANLDACLTFIDMFADGDVYFQFYHGREGMGLWEYDENGYVVPTQYAFDCAVQGVPAVFTNGESPTAWFDRPILAPQTKFGPDGAARDPRDMTLWNEIKLERDKSEETLQWRERFGYLNFTEWCKAEDAYTFNGPLQYVTNFIPAVDEWTQLTLDAIRDVMVTGSWKMVYAQTEEEFEAIWDQMMKDCADLGGADIVADRLTALEEAKAIKDSLAAN